MGSRLLIQLYRMAIFFKTLPLCESILVLLTLHVKKAATLVTSELNDQRSML